MGQERPPGHPADPQPVSREPTLFLPAAPSRLATTALAARLRLHAGLAWGVGVAVLLIIVVGATLAAGGRHNFPALSSTPDSNVANGALLAFPDPVLAGSGKGTTIIAWITPNGAMGQVWVSINGAPETLFAQGPSGAQYASWIEAGGSYEFRLYAGTTRVDPALKMVTVTRERASG